MNRHSILFAIALIAVIAFAGSVQASVTVGGTVNATYADGQIVTLWLDAYPADYTTFQVQDAGGPYNDYYWFSDISLMLGRHYASGTQNIPVTVVMNCSGTERDINGGLVNPYNNVYKSAASAHNISVDYNNTGTWWCYPDMELESCASKPLFIKTLYAGWNLISLPLDPEDNSASAVLSTVPYDAVYGYNATSKQFESADVMDPGTGYFVNATAESTWTYSGTAYTSVDVSLKQGLNMVGWLNCSKDIDALSSISGDYYYLEYWNTSTQEFDVYNPAAPSAFNDFTTMDRGTGYFISAKQESALSENC